MRASLTHERAIARWFAGGLTSRTHRVLQFALETYLVPLGIEADWLEAEPFSALESGVAGGWWLRGARWNPARFDPRRPGGADFAPLIKHPLHFRVAVESQGILSLSPASTAAAGNAAAGHLPGADAAWRLIRHTVRASQKAETFIYAAAGLLLASDSAAALYASGDDGSFCAAVEDCLASPPAAMRGAARAAAADGPQESVSAANPPAAGTVPPDSRG
jgi:hypothetical protein